MSDTAVHLVANVLPDVPVRHWVCSFPWGVRAVLGYDKALCRAATRAFAKEVSQSLKRRAKEELKLYSVSDALTGLVAVVQRTDGALRLNVHLHCLGLDGVCVRNGQGALEFHELKAPSSAEVADIARRTAQRLARAFRKQGRKSPWDDEGAFADSGEADPFSSEQPGCSPAIRLQLLALPPPERERVSRYCEGWQAEPRASSVYPSGPRYRSIGRRAA